MTKDEEDAVLAAAKEIERRRAEAYRAGAEIVQRRIKNLWHGYVDQRFGLDDLIFAAVSRCSGCGLGLAYPKKSGMHGSWVCSGILLGEATKEAKHDELPFMFYSVKNEGQPSANGATTRPDPRKPHQGES